MSTSPSMVELPGRRRRRAGSPVRCRPGRSRRSACGTAVMPLTVPSSPAGSGGAGFCGGGQRHGLGRAAAAEQLADGARRPTRHGDRAPAAADEHVRRPRAPSGCAVSSAPAPAERVARSASPEPVEQRRGTRLARSTPASGRDEARERRSTSVRPGAAGGREHRAVRASATSRTPGRGCGGCGPPSRCRRRRAG